MKKTIIAIAIIFLDLTLFISGLTCFIVSNFVAEYDLWFGLYTFGWCGIGSAIGSLITLIAVFIIASE